MAPVELLRVMSGDRGYRGDRMRCLELHKAAARLQQEGTRQDAGGPGAESAHLKKGMGVFKCAIATPGVPARKLRT